MSYCRWSSDDYQSDVYVWADIAGTWRTEVAGRRWIFTAPLPPPVTIPVGRDGWAEEWVARSNAVSALLDDLDSGHWYDLPEPEGGRSYEHDTPGECADNLARLAALGFHIPAGVIEDLRTEDSTPPGSTRG